MLFKHNIFNGVWMMEEGYATNFLPGIISFLKGEKKEFRGEQINPVSFFSAQANSNQFSSGPAEEEVIAIISISGAITKYNQVCGPSGMLAISEVLEACYASDNVNGIVLKVDSGGGEAYAMRLINETIAKRNKPIVGFIDDLACSAAYGLVSGTDVIVANSDLAQIGSIGTYLTIVDYSKQLEKEGINVIDIYASASTEKNKAYKDALLGNTKQLQALVDKVNESFLKTIETNRDGKLKESRETWGKGNVYFAEEALKLGLIDEIDTFDNVLNYFV